MSAFSSGDIPDLSDKIIIVTGGNAGLGFETIRQLMRYNPARIYLASRSQEKAECAITELERINFGKNNIKFLALDLASFESVKTAAASFLSRESRLDILINNAGIMMTPEWLSKDGYEIQFGTNVMGPALLTQLLLPVMRRTSEISDQVRVVFLSSAAHARAPNDIYKFDELRTTMKHRHTTERYTLSKLADLHYARALAEREPAVKIIAVHPGMVNTNLHHASAGSILRPFLYTAIALFGTPVEKGALSQIWAAVSPEVRNGQYYGPIAKVESGSKTSQNHALQEALFGWIQAELREYTEGMA